MQRISWKQTKAVLKALDILYSDPEPATLPTRILGAVKTAVASETILVDGFNATSEMNPVAQYPQGIMTPHEYGVLAQHLPQHPLFNFIIIKGQTKAFRTNEVASGTAFHRTSLYNEMYRPMSIGDQIIVRINGPKGMFTTCCLNRVKREFAEADRRAVDLISSHLGSAIGNAERLQTARRSESYLSNVFEEARKGIIVVGLSGEINYITDAAAALLQKYLQRRDFDTRKLPEVICSWLKQFEEINRSKDFHPPTHLLTLKGAEAELRINLVPDKRAGERILIIEEKRAASPLLLQGLGLTRREAEVLFWTAQGKTDSAIGVLCGISPRTVQIHLLRVYNKLGVENRTAATIRALELLQL